MKASALAAQNKADESLSALEDAQRVAPNALQPLTTLVLAYVKQGKADKAIALLEELKKQNPSSAQILVLIGQAKLAQKKEAEALQDFKDAITSSFSDC